MKNLMKNLIKKQIKFLVIYNFIILKYILNIIIIGLNKILIILNIINGRQTTTTITEYD
jgi:hypothetical protein